MKRIFSLALLTMLTITACAPVPAPTPLPATSVALLPTDTPAPTPTFTPTPPPTFTPTPAPTLTPTATPIPTIKVGDLTVPDPRATNPELFDLRRADAPIPQFVNAMRMAGMEVTEKQVAAGITYQALEDKDGRPFVVGVYHLDPHPQEQREALEGSVPLIIAKRDERSEWKWKEAFLRELAEPLHFLIGTGVGGFGFAQYYGQMVEVQTRGDFNLALLAVGPGWNESLTLPYPAPIFYDHLDSDVRIAQNADMVGYGHLLLWGAEAPNWFRDSNY